MKPITFCIPTAKNEKDYVHLLIRSLQENTEISTHEILVFIDSDNQNTYESLVEKQKELPNMKIHRNTTGSPIGGQRNISIMFDSAKNDIVCYLQSDMVVGPEFDKHINEGLTSESVFLCGTRIEPPVHPPSPDKFVENFGLGVDDFDYDKFIAFSKNIQLEKRPNTINYSVPFALYKKIWFDVLGGYDTQFRCSHEDIDSVVRLRSNGISIIQSWSLIIYHFTCVSSRGIDWFKSNEESKYKNEIQQLASNEESKRFLRKWGTLDRNVDFVYDIGLEISLDRFVDINFLKQIEPFCSKISINHKGVVNQLISQIEYDSVYYSNLRWNYSFEHWNSVKHLFNLTDFTKRIVSDTLDTDIIISCNYSDIYKNVRETFAVLENIQSIVHENDEGKYEYGNFFIEIRRKDNKIQTLLKPSNTKELLNSKLFEFA
jgi:GT2 family glycosyltransferase